MRKGIWLATMVALAALVLVGWFGLQVRAARQYRTELDLAKKEIAAKQYGRAWKRLSALALSQSADGEVYYHLGICEFYRGHPDRALSAWESVPPEGPFGPRAALQRGMFAMESGQFSRAERIFETALERGIGNEATILLRGLQLLYQVEGRTEDVRRAIVESWTHSETPAEVLKQLSRLESAPMPVEMTRKMLDKGADDDARVWLARANMAIRTGQFDRAAECLDTCSKRGSDDIPVWRARLQLARATGDVPSAWNALEHLPAGHFSESDQHRLRAWLASRLADTKAERAALTSLVAIEPGDMAVLDRLAALASVEHDDSEVARLRSRKSEMLAAHARYHGLLRGDSIGDPGKLADLAETLGRRIEATGWALIRDRKTGLPGPSRPALVASSGIGPSNPSLHGKTLAEMCVDLRREITQGPADRVATALPRFADEAQFAGLRFVHDNGATPLKRLPETMSGGVGLLDFDGDGWLDVFAVQGGTFPPPDQPLCGDRLYRNLGDGHVEDVTERAGIHRLPGGFGHGVAVGDYDNDGRPDLFVTRWRSYALLHNRGDGSFEDVTAKAGLGGDRDWPTSAAWADLDGDGDLDLYVCHYLVFDLKTAPICADAKTQVKHYCSPREFASLPDHVFRNDAGRFVDVTKVAGFVDPDGRGLGVVAADLDDDNRIDVYVANDMSANYLFHNEGGLRFRETAFAAGAAVNSSGGFQSGMGVACGDVDGDGRPDLAVTNYYGESTTLFHNLGRGLFADETTAMGLAAPTRPLLGFGIAFLDANNDGWLDLISANGHVSNYEPAFPWKMPIQLLSGGPEGRFTDVSSRAGDPFKPLHLGRGLAVGDLDNDGRFDAVVQSQNEPLVYLQNQTVQSGHWLTIQLEGERSNRDGVGARVIVEADGCRQSAQRIGGGSYQSASDPRLHFGLSQSTRVDHVDVRWPSGRIDRYERLEPDHGYLLREGAPTAKPLRGYDRRRG